MKRWIGALSVAMTLMVWVAVPAHALAGAYCGAWHRNGLFDGFENSTMDLNWWEGTSAFLTVKKALACSNDCTTNNTISAWSMIADNANPTLGTEGGWAQTGYLRWCGSSIYHFSHWTQLVGGPTFTKIQYTVQEGETHHYWTQYVSSCGCLRLNVDVTTFDTTKFNPWGNWHQPWATQWFGETKYLESDVPGTGGGNHARFGGMQTQEIVGDTWSNGLSPLTGANDNQARWSQSAYSNNAFDIWTCA